MKDKNDFNESIKRLKEARDKLEKFNQVIDALKKTLLSNRGITEYHLKNSKREDKLHIYKRFPIKININ